MIRKTLALLVVVVAIGLVFIAPANGRAAESATAPTEKSDKLSYRGDVWPILKRHCWGCHTGADAKGRLRLDSVADMLRGGESGPLFEPGKADESLLIKMVVGDKPEMPKMQPPLSAAKIATLRAWILSGAKDDSAPATTAQPLVRIPESYKFAPAINSVALSPDGKLAAVACRSEVLLVDVDGSTPPRRFATTADLLLHVEFSPDGALLAATGGTPGRHGEVRFLTIADGKWATERRIGEDTLFRGSFAPDGQTFAVGAPDGAILIVPTAGQGDIRRLELHSDWVLDVAYSPDGKLLVSGGRDKATKVSSVETGRLVRSVDASTDWISSVAANDLFAVSSGRGRKLTAYEFKTALQGIEVTGSGNGARPVNKRDQYVRPMEGSPGEIMDLAVSGDRKLLAIAGAFPEVRIYNFADRQRSATITKVDAPVHAASLDAAGTRLAVGGKSGVLQVFELPSGKLLKSVTAAPVAGSAN